MTTSVTSPLGPQFNTTQAAVYLGISIRHLRGLIETNKITTLRDGRVRIYQRWCDEYIATRTTVPDDATAPSVRGPKAAAEPVGIAHLMPSTRRFLRGNRRTRVGVGAST